MTKRDDALNQGLQNLRQTMMERLAVEVNASEFQSKLRSTVEAHSARPSGSRELEWQSSVSAQPGRHPSRIRKLGPLVAGLAAVAVVVLSISFGLSRGSLLRGTPTGTASPQPLVSRMDSVDWSAGFAPLTAQQLNQFHNVTAISVVLGNGTGSAPVPGSVDGAQITLTPTQQHAFFAAIQSSQSKTMAGYSRPGSMPFQITLGYANGQSSGSIGGYFGTGGALILGNQLIAPNAAVAEFLNHYLVAQIAQKYVGFGKLMTKDPVGVARQFVALLGTPAAAYRYCVPDTMFTNSWNMLYLQQQAATHAFRGFDIQSFTYSPDGSSAVAILGRPHKWWRFWDYQSVSVRLEKIGDGWLITEVGQKFTGDSYDGVALMAGFGSYDVLVIGSVPPTQKGVHYTQIGYNDSTNPAWDTARIIVYERHPLTGQNASQSDAASALQRDPVFEKAVAEAKSRRVVLAVVNGSDNLLSTKMLMDALGGVESITGYDTRPAASSSVWFVGPKQGKFGGATYIINGKTDNRFGAFVVDNIIAQATLTIDTDGAE